MQRQQLRAFSELLPFCYEEVLREICFIGDHVCRVIESIIAYRGHAVGDSHGGDRTAVVECSAAYRGYTIIILKMSPPESVFALRLLLYIMVFHQSRSLLLMRCSGLCFDFNNTEQTAGQTIVHNADEKTIYPVVVLLYCM